MNKPGFAIPFQYIVPIVFLALICYIFHILKKNRDDKAKEPFLVGKVDWQGNVTWKKTQEAT